MIKTQMMAVDANGLNKPGFIRNLALTILASALIMATGGAATRVINVKEAPYSAAGDGVHDDAPAINMALEKAREVFDNEPEGLRSGVAVYFPAGTYLITQRLKFESKNPQPNRGAGIMIRGDGKYATTIKSNHTGGALLVKLNVNGIANMYVTLADFSIVASQPSAGTGVEILPYMTDAGGRETALDEDKTLVHLQARNMDIRRVGGGNNCFTYGIKGINLAFPEISNSNFTGNAARTVAAIDFENFYGHDIKDCTITGAQTGLRAYQGGEGNFIGRVGISDVDTGVHIENVPFHVKMSSCGGTLINSNISARTCGIRVKYKADFFISNSTFTPALGASSYKDVEMLRTDRTFIARNHFAGAATGATGIVLNYDSTINSGKRASTTTICDNVFESRDIGVSVGTDVYDTMIFNNDYSGTPTPLSDRGTGTFSVAGLPEPLSDCPVYGRESDPFSWSWPKGQLFDVTDYLPAASGNATKAIQNAVYAAEEFLNGGSLRVATIYFPAGTYNVTECIKINAINGQKLQFLGDGKCVSVIVKRPGGVTPGLFDVKVPASVTTEMHYLTLAPECAETQGAGVRVEQTAMGASGRRSFYVSDVDIAALNSGCYFYKGFEGIKLRKPYFENVMVRMGALLAGSPPAGSTAISMTGGAGFVCDGLVIPTNLETGIHIQSTGQEDILFRNRNGIGSPPQGVLIDAGGQRVAFENFPINSKANLDIRNASRAWFLNSQMIAEDLYNEAGRATFRFANCARIDVYNILFSKSIPYFCNLLRKVISFENTNANAMVYGCVFEEPGETVLHSAAGWLGPALKYNRFTRTDIVDTSGPIGSYTKSYVVPGSNYDYYLLHNQLTGRYLGANGTASSQVDCKEQDLGDDVQWMIVYHGNGQYYLVNKKLSVNLLTRSGADVDCTSTGIGGSTLWNVLVRSGGLFTLSNPVGKFLRANSMDTQVDADGTAVADDTKWQLILAQDLIVGMDWDQWSFQTNPASAGWRNVLFSRPFNHPPAVVLGAAGIHGEPTGTLSLRTANVTQTGFSFRVQPVNGTPDVDQMHYIAMHKGRYLYNDQLDCEVGTQSNVPSNAWVTHVFERPFDVVPCVLAQCATANNGNNAADVRVKDVTSTSFKARIFKQGSWTGTPLAENVDFIAIEPGISRYFEVGRMANAAIGNWNTFEFKNETGWPSAGFIGCLQSYNTTGMGTMWCNSTSSTPTAIQVKYDDGSATGSHEDIGWMAFENKSEVEFP